MRRIALLALTACQATVPEMPWLHGLDRARSSTGITEPRAPDDDEIADGCGVAASRRIELIADVSPAAGRETVVASFSGGISVFDSEDHLLAETPGYPCEGTADELDVVAFGRAYGEPILAIAATSGGRREAATWISLFNTRRAIEPVFTAVVETREDDVTKTGAIYLLPDRLLYLRPGGRPTLWRFDPNARVYVPMLPELPHDEPLVSQREPASVPTLASALPRPASTARPHP